MVAEEDDVYLARIGPLERKLDRLEQELAALRKQPDPEPAKIEEVKEEIADVQEEIQEEKQEEESSDGNMGNDDAGAEGEEEGDKTSELSEEESEPEPPKEQAVLIAVATPEPESKPDERTTATRKRGFTRGKHARAQAPDKQ